jgi:protein-disulfide isomerase
VIIGAAVIGGALIIRSALQKTTDQMGEIRLALNDTRQALVTAASARPAAPSAPSGPDPNRRYTVNTAGAPARGPNSAKVKIVEFSDFQ